MENSNGLALRTLSLCAGIGGLDLGIKLAYPSARTVCYVEREAFAAGILAQRMQEGALDEAPIWDDLGTFNGHPWRNAVDLVAAGFPCQPVSVAGKQLGSRDDRWLWPEVLRVVREVRPSYVFLENVRGLFSHGFGEVLKGLADAGFHAEWGVFSAADVGATHRRERVFVLAYAHSQGLEGREVRGCQGPHKFFAGADIGALGCGTWPPAPEREREWQETSFHLWPIELQICGVADGVPRKLHSVVNCNHGQEICKKSSTEKNPRNTLRGVWEIEWPTGAASRRLLETLIGSGAMSEMSSGSGPGCRTFSGNASPEMRDMWKRIQTLPKRAQYSLWFLRMSQRLREVIGEKEMGWQEVDAELRRLWEGLPAEAFSREDLWSFMWESASMVAPNPRNRIDRLRALGNGVVPLAAAYAFRTLSSRIPEPGD